MNNKIASKHIAAQRRVCLGDEPIIVHCHHYNTFLQQTIQDADYIESYPFLVGAANEVAFHQLSTLFDERQIHDIAARKRMAEAIYLWAGFGTLDLAPLNESGGTTQTANSHYSQAWLQKFGQAQAPVDFFSTGWLTGALAAVYGVPQGHYSCRQLSCLAQGSANNKFRLSIEQQPSYSVFVSPAMGLLTPHQPRSVPPSPVDYEGIYQAVSSMPLAADSNGSIAAFGVYLTRHYANYYNRISFEFTHHLIEKLGAQAQEIAQPLLVEAGHVCAFNTFGGIMCSSEWDALIRPCLVSQEDWVHGIVAAINALGWGRWQVGSLSEDEALFVIHDDYESVGHLASYGESKVSVSHLAHGAAIGIMNLVYLGEVHNKPDFTEAFYDRLFKSDASYLGSVVDSRAAGDEVTTIRVYRPK